MNDVIRGNRSTQNNRRLYSSINNSLVDVDELAEDVISEFNNVKSLLQQGLPKSVYQLKLFNHLLKKGFKLETELSMLNHCVKSEPDRELIIVNGVLVMECVSGDDLHRHHQKKRIMFDLMNNGHTLGLLINFDIATKGEGIVKVFHDFCLH